MAARFTFRRVSLWVPPIVYMALIFFLSSRSDPAPILTQNFWDKGLHFVGYAGLAFVFARAFAGERAALLIALTYAFIASSAYGATDEWHQAFTPGRNSDIEDWFADTVGSVLGVIAYAIAQAGLKACTTTDRGPGTSTVLHQRRRLRR